MPGAHNRENAAAATAAARAAGIDDDAIARALESFPGVEHRLELVAEIGGVTYVNDSKATNTAAARRALAAYDAPLHVILGGSLKGEDFVPLAEAMTGSVRAVYLIGEAADELEAALRPTGIPLSALRRPRDGGGAGGGSSAARARSCCSRPRVRASTSFVISSIAARSSAVWCRS